MLSSSNQQDLKSANRAAVLDQILRSAPISRQQIAANLGLSPSTVTLAVQDLIRRGLIEESGSGVSSGGRRPILLNFKSGKRFTLSIDLSSVVDKRLLRAAALDFTGNILSDVLHAYEISSNQELTRAIIDTIDELLGQPETGPDNALAIGLSLPGLIDSSSGTVVYTHMGVKDLPIGPILEQRYHLPALVYNSEDVAALGEFYFGAGKGASNLLYLTAGNGVGAGLVINGRIYPQVGISAGEIGHVTIVPDGPACYCGNRGCLTRLLNIDDMIQSVADKMGTMQFSNIEDMLKAASQGQKECLDTLRQTAEWVGIAAANAINLLNPEVIIFDGDLFDRDDFFLSLVKEAAGRRAFFHYLPGVRMVRSKLGRDAGLKGIGVLAMTQAFRI